MTFFVKHVAILSRKDSNTNRDNNPKHEHNSNPNHEKLIPQ